MSDEYFDLVDENNVPLGRRELRSVVHTQGFWHRTVHVYLYRINAGVVEFLVHHRAKTKDVYPDRWDTRFGGHVKAGESVEQTRAQELKEETGIELELSKLLQGETYKRDVFPDRGFSTVSYYRFDGDLDSLTFNDGEVQSVKWMTSDEIDQALHDEPDHWSTSVGGFQKIFLYLQSML